MGRKEKNGKRKSIEKTKLLASGSYPAALWVLLTTRCYPEVSRIRPNALWIHPKVLRILHKLLHFKPNVVLS